MPLAGLLALISILARAPQPSPSPVAERPGATAAADPYLANGREVPRCPENLRLEGSNRALGEVPDTPIRLADKTGGMPGWVPPREAWPVPCVTPARRR